MIIEIKPSDLKATEIRIEQNGISTTYALVTNPEPLPPPITLPYPVGKGMLIWRLAKVANGNMALMAEQAKTAGFKWVSIKVIERGRPYSINSPFIVNAVNELKRVGISARGWGYLYPDADQISHARTTADEILRLSLDGYELDVEGEWKVPTNKKELAKVYSQELRNRVGTLGLGFCSYRYPSLHREIPWAEFLEICDYHAPQVYWIGTRLAVSPQHQLERSHRELIALKNMPYIPIGSATWSDDRTWEPSVDQLNNFYSASQTYPGYGWYEWFPAFSKQEWWRAITAHK